MIRTFLKLTFSLLVLGALALSGPLAPLNEQPAVPVVDSDAWETADFATSNDLFPAAPLASLRQFGQRLAFSWLAEPGCRRQSQPLRPSGSNNLVPDCWLASGSQSTT